MANTTCPACGHQVDAPLIFIGTLQMIEECPDCAQGPLAVNLDRCELNTEPDVEAPITLNFTHPSKALIKRAIHSCHPDYMDATTDELDSCIQHHYKDGQLAVPTPKLFVRLVMLAMDNEFPEITIKSPHKLPELNSLNDNPLFFSHKEETSPNRATELAHRNLYIFIQHLQNPHPQDSQFGVKVPISDGEASEDIWLSEVSYQNNQFIGKVRKPPQSVKSVKVGEIQRVPSKQITDWRFMNGEAIFGDYSLRAMQSTLPLEVREELAMRFQ